MTKDKVSNVAASVRQRLLNIIRETGDDANRVWTRYATERLLYRLSVSEDARDFILKGAMLFMAWTGQSHRPTVDMDFLGHGENSSERLPGQRPSPRAGAPAVHGCQRNPQQKKDDGMEDAEQDWGKFSVVLRRTL
jgi:hypothetical protein